MRTAAPMLDMARHYREFQSTSKNKTETTCSTQKYAEYMDCMWDKY